MGFQGLKKVNKLYLFFGIFVLFYLTLSITFGTFKFIQYEIYDLVFDNMWRHLYHGKFDIDYDVIRFESFLKDGKVYTYFGIMPSVLRGIFILFNFIEKE